MRKQVVSPQILENTWHAGPLGKIKPIWGKQRADLGFTFVGVEGGVGCLSFPSFTLLVNVKGKKRRNLTT